MTTGEPRRPKLADVARLAGTSTAVVSYVINDGPRPVSASTRERVLKVIAETGYRPSRAARALRSQRQSFIGLVVPGMADPFYVQLAQEVEAAALRRGYLTMTGNSGFSTDQERALLDEGVAGVIVAGLGNSKELHALLTAAPTRAVFLHNRPEGVDGALVTVDNRAWSRRATDHLFDHHGCPTVALLTHDDDEGPVGERTRGWRDAVQARATAGAEHIIRSRHDRQSASRAMSDWLSLPDRPRAVFAATDELAFGALHAAGKLGLRIPEDLAIISFDGVFETATTVPELSTITEPFEEMGERAVELLLERTDDNGVHYFECAPVYRASCGCAADVTPG